MSIGAIGAYGAVNAFSFRPYVYNANTVSAASMNKLSRISDDVLDKKIDYSEFTEEALNENPLRKGQTLDFQGILDMQMRRGQSQAARIMRPMGAVQGAAEAAGQSAAYGSGEVISDRPVAEDMKSAADQRAAEDTRRDRTAEAAVNADDSSNHMDYQMQQALRAYEMFMTA